MLKTIIISIVFIGLVCPYNSDAQGKKRNKEERAQREAEFYFTEGEKYYILNDYAKALVLFEQAKEILPDNAAIYYKMAQIYEQNDELEKAFFNIDKSLKLEKNNKYYYLLAANIQTRLGNFKAAADLYEKMIATIDNTDNYLLELAAIYLYQDELDLALQTYNRAEDYYGVNEEISAQKQKIYLNMNNLNGALEEGKKLIAHNPENEMAIVAQSDLLLSNDRSREAIDFLEGHLKDFPEHALVNMQLGNIYLANNEIDKASIHLLKAYESPLLNASIKIQALATMRTNMSGAAAQELSLALAEKLITTHDDIADSYSIYGDILFTLGKADEAKNQYLKALQLDGSNFTLWQNVLQLYLQVQKFDSVLIVSEQALELFPNQNSLYYYRGLANLRSGHFEDAIVDLNRGKMLSASDPKLVSAFNGMLGEAYHALRQYQKSDDAFEAALDYDPDNPMILNNYSYFLALRKEHLEKAEEMAQRLVENNPENPSFLDTYAWVLFKKGEYKEAKEALTPLIESGKALGAHHDHYGDILFKLGKKDVAVEQWKIAKEKDANIRNIDKKIADRKIYE